jgi:hypothetical protein
MPFNRMMEIDFCCEQEKIIHLDGSAVIPDNQETMGNGTDNQKTEPSGDLKGGFFRKIFHHPNFNVIAGLFGILGTFLAIYFYCQSIQKPDLTYYVSSTRTPIVQKGNLENFSVTFLGTTITNDLSSATR